MNLKLSYKAATLCAEINKGVSGITFNCDQQDGHNGPYRRRNDRTPRHNPMDTSWFQAQEQEGSRAFRHKHGEDVKKVAREGRLFMSGKALESESRKFRCGKPYLAYMCEVIETDVVDRVAEASGDLVEHDGRLHTRQGLPSGQWCHVKRRFSSRGRTSHTIAPARTPSSRFQGPLVKMRVQARMRKHTKAKHSVKAVMTRTKPVWFVGDMTPKGLIGTIMPAIGRAVLREMALTVGQNCKGSRRASVDNYTTVMAIIVGSVKG